MQTKSQSLSLIFMRHCVGRGDTDVEHIQYPYWQGAILPEKWGSTQVHMWTRIREHELVPPIYLFTCLCGFMAVCISLLHMRFQVFACIRFFYFHHLFRGTLGDQFSASVTTLRSQVD